MEAISRNPQHGDGIFTIEISEDALSVYGEFRPAVGNGADITIDYVEDVLSQNDVSYNIDWFRIHTSIAECNSNHRIVSGVPVALGVPPEPQIPERVVVEAKFRRRRPVAGEIHKTSGAIDLRERHLLVIVQQGELVARRVPAQDGKEGVTVHGTPIPIPAPRVPQPEIGENLEEQDGRIIAAVGGRLVFDDKKIAVEETLILAEGVGYHTGHIRFPGNCVLSGAVKPGFRIRLGGSLHVKETIDVTEVYCGERIVCDGGLLGHGQGVVRSKGSIRAAFIENCVIESHRAIYIQKNCLYGKVRTLGRVVLGDKSRVIASEIVSAQGVYAFSLGNQQGSRVIVWAGINFVVERKIDSLRKKVEDIAFRISRLRIHLETHDSLQVKSRLQELMDQRNEMQQKIGDLLGSLDSSEDSRVAVKDKIYPGTVIHICRAHYVVEKVLKGVEFRLDAASGVIVQEALNTKNFPKLQELESGD
ncbi:MAG: DUF342 domain-containing protein [Spirochaeta sp.]